MVKDRNLFDDLLARAESRWASASENEDKCKDPRVRRNEEYFNGYVNLAEPQSLQSQLTEEDYRVLQYLCFQENMSLAMEFSLIEARLKMKKMKLGKRKSRSKKIEEDTPNGIKAEPKKTEARVAVKEEQESKNSKFGVAKQEREIKKERTLARRNGIIKRGLWADGLIQLDMEKHKLRIEKEIESLDRQEKFKSSVSSLEEADFPKERIEINIPTRRSKLQLDSDFSRGPRMKLEKVKKVIEKAAGGKIALKLSKKKKIKKKKKKIKIKKSSGKVQKVLSPAYMNSKGATPKKRTKAVVPPFFDGNCAQEAVTVKDMTIDGDLQSFVHGDFVGDGKAPYQCLECGGRSETFSRLRSHLRVLHDVKTADLFIIDTAYKCPVTKCEVSCSSLLFLNAHIRANHPLVEEVSDVVPCRHCSAYFPTQRAHVKHMCSLYKATVIENSKRTAERSKL